MKRTYILLYAALICASGIMSLSNTVNNFLHKV